MKVNSTLLLLTMLLFTKISFGQDQVKLDSLLSVYNSQAQDSLKVKTAYAIYDFYIGHKQEVALQYSLEGLDLAKKIDFKKGIAAAFNHKGRHFMNLREIDSARFYFDKALEIYTETKYRRKAGFIKYNIIQLSYLAANYDEALSGITETMKQYSEPVDSIILLKLHLISSKVYMRLAMYDAGFESAFKALNIAEALKLENEQIKVKSSLASLYHYTDNKEKSIEIKKELLEIHRNQNNIKKIGLTLNDIGNSNYGIKNYDIALEYLTESLTYSKKAKNQGLIGITLFNIGKTYVRKGSIEKGIDFLKKSIHHSQHISYHPLSESWALKELGGAYVEELKQPKKALPYLNRAIVLADSVGNKDDLYQAYRERSKVYAALGFYQKALQDHEAYKAINDSVYSIEKSKEIDRLKAVFETKEKEQQIALQENEIDVLEQQEQVSKLQKVLLGGGLLLTLGLIGFGFYGFKQRLKRNKLEKEKVDAELTFKKKELTTHALHLAKKNEVLEGLKLKAEELKNSDPSQQGYQQLIRTIDFDLKDDDNWENFSRYFLEVHRDFNSNVKQQFPDVTSNELRLMALLKMNLSSKEIANILNISQEGIKKARYRLRKKLDISTEDSLQDLVLSL